MALKVLLADDSVPAQNMGKKILTDAGYEVLAVSNGLEALKKIADKVPDIAILDIFMPGYTGLEVCQRLRGNAVTAELPVILTVGKLEPYRPEDGEKVHSSAVIVKPFASEELLSAVRSLVGLPFAIRPEATEAKAPAPALEPTPASGPVLEDDYEEEAPMLAGIGFEPIGFDGAPSASASSPQQAKFGLAGDPAGGLGWDPDAKRTGFSASAVEEVPATSGKRTPAFEATAASSAISDFEIEPATSPFASTAATATALVEWWQPTPEPAEQIEASELEFSSLPAEILKETPHESQTEGEHTPGDTLATLPEPPSPAAEVVKHRADSALAAAIEAPVPDRESRMQAFEALFNSDEALPVEASPAALPDLLAQEELETLQQDEAESVSLFALEHRPDEGLPIAAAASAATNDLEMAGSHELQFDAESISNWLTTGALPQEPQPPVAAKVENSPAEPAPACESFYAAIPEDAELSESSKPAEPLLEASQTAVVESSSPMVCFLPKKETAESSRESSVYASLQRESTEFAPAETVTPPSEAEQIVGSQAEEQESMANLPAEPAPPSAEEIASDVMEQMTCELVQAGADSEQTCDENIEERETLFAAANPGGEAKRVHQAVESVFDRFRPLLIAAIARELTKRD